MTSCYDPPAPEAAENPGGALLDLIGRIMMTHRLSPDLLVAALGVSPADAAALIDHGRLPSHGGIQHDRVRLFANILQRLEWRLRHDASAIRRAFDLPLDTLSGRTPAGMLAGSLDDLRRLRTAIDTIEAPAVKWYRVGH